MLAILGGCGSDSSAQPAHAASAAMTFEDAPQGIGRGFPVALLTAESEQSPALKVGSPAPQFTLEFEDGRSLTLADLQGRPVMVNFWATWCPPCRNEMPEIVRQAEADEELVVLAVNVNEEIDLVRRFSEEYRMAMPVVMDQDASLADLYLVRGMPTSIFIGRDGIVASIWEGMLSASQLESHLAGIR